MADLRPSKSKILAIGLTFALTLIFSINSNATNSANANVLNNWYVLTWGKQPKMYQVNKSTGALTLIAQATQDTGSDNNTGAAGFDVDATNSVGYFIPYSNNPASLWKVDLVSGQFTYIANSDAVSVTALDIGNNGDVWIAADNLDGQGRGFGRVNVSTGDATFLTAGPERIAALATAANGTLYAFSYSAKIYTVNTSNYSFTQVGTLPSNILAADIDDSGDIILTDWSGNISKYDLDTNTSTSLFQARDSNNQIISTEALGVGGPTNGQTLTQAVTNPQGNSQPTGTAAAAPIVATDLGNVTFSPNSSRLSNNTKDQLRKFVQSHQTAKSYKAIGYVQFYKGTKQDARLALARANAVKEYLKSIGVTLEIATEEGIAPQDISKKSQARMVRLLAYGS